MAQFFVGNAIPALPLTGVSGQSVRINHGGNEDASFPLTNMFNLSRTRITKITMNTTGLLVVVELPAVISIDAIVLPRFKTDHNVRIRGHSGTNANGSVLIDSGMVTADKAGLGGDSLGWLTNWVTANSPVSVQSISIYFSGFSGQVVELTGVLAGLQTNFTRCIGEPTLKPLFGGSLAQTVSGMAVQKTLSRPGREISAPYPSMTEADRDSLHGFMLEQANNAFFACLMPDGNQWELQNYSLLARFKPTSTFKRRGRTVNHQSGFVLLEA